MHLKKKKTPFTLKASRQSFSLPPTYRLIIFPTTSLILFVTLDLDSDFSSPSDWGVARNYNHGHHRWDS